METVDGCSSQYKSKGPFTDISDTASQYEQNFFRSLHGKGPAGGEAAVVKEGCRKAIKSGEEISDSVEMYIYLNSSHLHIKPTESDHKYYRRSFFPQKNIIATTVKGTRNFHCVTNLTPGVNTRHLSCYCDNCSQGLHTYFVLQRPLNSYKKNENDGRGSESQPDSDNERTGK